MEPDIRDQISLTADFTSPTFSHAAARSAKLAKKNLSFRVQHVKLTLKGVEEHTPTPSGTSFKKHAMNQNKTKQNKTRRLITLILKT